MFQQKSRLLRIFKITIASLTMMCSVFGSDVVFAQPPSQIDTIYDTGDRVPGNPDNEVKIMNHIYHYVQIYRQGHGGKYPDTANNSGGLLLDIFNHPAVYDFKSLEEASAAFDNPDNEYADNSYARANPHNVSLRQEFFSRLDGSPFGSPKPLGSKDLLAASSLYFHYNPPGVNTTWTRSNPVGFFIILWDDGQTQKVPYDQIIYSFSGSGTRITYAYPGQAGVPWNSCTYAENLSHNYTNTIPIGYPLVSGQINPKPDNGGIESLVWMTRLFGLNIMREPIWDSLGHQVKDFMLQEVADGAKKIDFPLQKKTITLDELQKLHTPAMLYLNDAGRIVTMSTIDDNHAIIYDRGITLIVSRAELAKRYGGEALIAASVNAASSLQVDQPIRFLNFSSKDAEVVQNIKITNHGTKPVSLLIERPLCGVTDAKLSQDNLAPRASANLELHFKWRDVLPGDHQSTFVTLKTDDPAQPRLQFGFDLKLAEVK